MEIRQVGIIGAGKAGGCIALACAFAKFNVILSDENAGALQQGSRAIDLSLARMLAKRKIGTSTARTISERIYFSTRQDLTVACDIVIEHLGDSVDAKRKILGQLYQVATQNTVIAENASRDTLNELTDAIRNSVRLIGMNVVNQIPELETVEILRGRYTSEETVSKAQMLASHLRHSSAGLMKALDEDCK